MSRYAGIVEKGEEYGRKIGFPTANIPLTDDSLSGIYAAKVFVNGEEKRAAVYADTKRRLLEAHILNFNDDLYGEEIEIELLEKIREDRRFGDEEDARTTIRADIEAAEAYFQRVN